MVDRSLLAARIKEILDGHAKPTGPRLPPASPAGVSAPAARRDALDEEAAFAARCAADEAASETTQVLGARTLELASGACLVVEREYPGHHVHGRHAVARYASAAAAGLAGLPWFLRAGRGAADRPGEVELDLGAERHGLVDGLRQLLFFDLETTGLSGGAGTYAFLVGCGYFEDDVFRTRQFFLRGYGEERPLLEAVRAFLDEPAGSGACLVSYNGRAFDVPLIETRYLFHRSTSPFASLPHVDMLFPARRLWRRRLCDVGLALDPLDGSQAQSPGDLRASCALTALEQDILGLQRADDVPGWEIPARFFAYARTGDARGLVAVMEHNRLDLLSLAAVTSLILERAIAPDRAPADRHSYLSLARLLEYLGRAEAERCYERAADADGLSEGRLDRLARAEALHWLARHRRRGRRFVEAADAWSRLLQIPGLDGALRREACEALAVHHEHRAKDLGAAQSYALRVLELADDARRVDEVRHRLNRLSRKLSSPTASDRAWVE